MIDLISRTGVILGIVLCVAAFTVIGYFTITTLTKPEKPGLRCVCTGGCKSCEALWIDGYDWSDLNLLKVSLSNVEPSPVFFQSLSPNSIVLPSSSFSGDCMPYFDTVRSDGLLVGQSCNLEIRLDGTAFSNGVAYALTIRTAMGLLHSKAIVAGNQS